MASQETQFHTNRGGNNKKFWTIFLWYQAKTFSNCCTSFWTIVIVLGILWWKICNNKKSTTYPKSSIFEQISGSNGGFFRPLVRYQALPFWIDVSMSFIDLLGQNGALPTISLIFRFQHLPLATDQGPNWINSRILSNTIHTYK